MNRRGFFKKAAMLTAGLAVMGAKVFSKMKKKNWSDNYDWKLIDEVSRKNIMAQKKDVARNCCKHLLNDVLTQAQVDDKQIADICLTPKTTHNIRDWTPADISKDVEKNVKNGDMQMYGVKLYFISGKHVPNKKMFYAFEEGTLDNFLIDGGNKKAALNSYVIKGIWG